MHLTTRNVNTAFRELVSLFAGHQTDGPYTKDWGHKQCSVVRRPYKNPNGEGFTLTIDEPVTITYTHPTERVLFNVARDANPFFHLYEALWMLAGRNDVKPLAYYNSKIKDFSDDGKTFNGAYGYRWRSKQHVQEWSDHPVSYNMPKDWGQVDQLDIIVNHLKANPDSRRAVLQMWNVEDDLLRIGPDREDCPIRVTSKDVCCNLEVMFSLRESGRISAQGVGKPDKIQYVLDITVTNRSNDLIWGTLGTDYVDFSFLQEYIAARLGVGVGRYHQFSNNLHVYDWNWRPDEWLQPHGMEGWYHNGGFEPNANRTFPLVSDPAAFEKELPVFVEQYGNLQDGIMVGPFTEYTEPFLRDVAQPMLDAYLAYKHRGAATMMHTKRILADDWRIAAQGWIERRLNKNAEKPAAVLTPFSDAEAGQRFLNAATAENSAPISVGFLPKPGDPYPVKNASDRADELYAMDIGDVPPLAMAFRNHLVSTLGLTVEVIMRAFMVYAQVVELRPCAINLYIPTADDVKWFAENMPCDSEGGAD